MDTDFRCFAGVHLLGESATHSPAPRSVRHAALLLLAVARSVFAPCLARRSRHWQARSTAESRLNLERLEPRMAFAAGPCT